MPVICAFYTCNERKLGETIPHFTVDNKYFNRHILKHSVFSLYSPAFKAAPAAPKLLLVCYFNFMHHRLKLPVGDNIHNKHAQCTYTITYPSRIFSSSFLHSKKTNNMQPNKIVAIRFFLGIGNPFWKQYSKVDATKKGLARCMCMQ